MSRPDSDRSRSPQRSHRRSRDDDGDQPGRRRHEKRRRNGDDYDERPRKKRSLSPRSDSNNEGRTERRRRRDRSRSPRRSHHKRRPRSRSASPQALLRSRAPLPPQNRAFEREQGSETPTTIEKQKPNFAPSGKLAAASKTVQTAGQTIILKYHEPAEARKPSQRDAWRMYVFKNDEIVDTVPLHEQSCWLFGRELAVCDIATEHPSCSGQHAVVQFRYSERRNEFGDKIGKVKPYVLDLESAHGTCVNGERIDGAKYVELRDGDVLKFGLSRREYVVQLPKG